jgi:hypothetical protein
MPQTQLKPQLKPCESPVRLPYFTHRTPSKWKISADLAPELKEAVPVEDGIGARHRASAIFYDRHRYALDHVICADVDALQTWPSSNRR